MATLVVITHEYDAFTFRKAPSAPMEAPYLLFDVLHHLQELGHRCVVVRGPRAESGDATLLHVDSTVVAPEYLELRKHYPQAFNFATADISKRRVSRLLLSRNDAWEGSVIVKSNYNNHALMEDLHNRRALKTGRPLPHPGVKVTGPYQVFESLTQVGEDVWSNPALVVERFVPEQDEDGNFVIRTWVFMGTRERCTRFVTTDRISKAADVIRYEPIEVPLQLRAERDRLGFDFGKFDFVMQGGEPILLDANRTPGVALAIRPLMKEGALNLARGLHDLLTGEAAP